MATGLAPTDSRPVPEAGRPESSAGGRKSRSPRPGARPRAPVVLAAILVFASTATAVAFLAAGLPAACEPGASSTGAPKPGASKKGAVPEGLYSVYSERIRDPSRADLSRMTPARVVRVVDGDTAVVEIFRSAGGLSSRETVRLIGVDAPELARAGRPADPGGSESAKAARALLDRREVLLAFDRELRDRYGRVLAYLYSTSGICLNLRLVESGAARALLKYPFEFSAAFSSAEREARAARKGLWALL